VSDYCIGSQGPRLHRGCPISNSAYTEFGEKANIQVIELKEIISPNSRQNAGCAPYTFGSQLRSGFRRTSSLNGSRFRFGDKPYPIFDL
jgi:hypothetical protein